MTRNSKFDEIDRMFDELQKENDETVSSLKGKLSIDNDDLVSLKNETFESRAISVHRPALPSRIPSDIDTRMDIFLYCLKNVDYGSSNNRQYVEGHLEALNKYLEEAKLNSHNLEVVFGAVSNEIKNFSASKTNLKEKGYYDGLSYVNQAIKKSRDNMASKINTILKRELFQ